MPCLPSAGRRMWRSILKSFVRRNTVPHRRSPLGRIELLEDRSVPATFSVNTFLDTAAANLSLGIDSSGNTSLRSALQTINSQGGTHTIDLQTGTYFLSLGELPINGSPTKATVTIDGDGSANTIIDAQNASRVFRNYSGNTTTIEGVTIQHGLTTGSSDSADGGGIYNSGTLTINQSLIAENSAPGTSGDGGGIFNSFGTLTVISSRLTGNTFNSTGGAINNSAGTLSILDSKIDNNLRVGTSGNGACIEPRSLVHFK